jgi:hypothetical protein
MRSRGLVLAAIVALAGGAHAAESAPAPNLELQLVERGPGLPWVLTIVNRAADPVRLAADPRLLALEVEPPGKKKPELCRLPGNLFPSRSDQRTEVTLAPGEGVAHSFDPRLYCFASGGQWQLVPGAVITPRFGWKEKTKTSWKGGKRVETRVKQSPPYVAMPANADADEEEPPGAIKELTGQPFSLRTEYIEWSRARLVREQKNKGPLELSILQGADARAELNATLTVRLKNTSKKSLLVYFRRELVSFEVMGPDGLITCDAQPDDRAPDRQAFRQLGPGGSTSHTSRLVELCPRGTFGRPGLYLVHARFEPNESGERFGLDAHVGQVLSEQPATIRIRTGELPFLKKRTMQILPPTHPPPPESSPGGIPPRR